MLVVCCSSLFIVGLDATVVNVALPSIGRDLHGGVSGLQWTIDGYTLVLASLLMLAGATADRVGRRRVFMTGLTVFGIGSGLCSLAPSLGALVAFRMLQAAGGSMLNPVAMSIIANTYTERAERARAIGIWGGAFGISMALGPVVGGVLVDSVGWRGAFWVNIPVCVLALILTLRYVPESRAPSPRRPDPVGQVLITVMLGTLTYAIIEGPGRGWTSPLILALFAASGLAITGLALYETRRREPVIDLRFFRSAPFTGSVLTAITASGAFAGFLLLATLYLQEARGLPPLRAGLHLLPMAVLMAAASFWSGRILARRNALLPMLGAGAALIAGGVLLSRLTGSSPTPVVLVAFMVFGLGSGLVNAPITNAAVSGMPPAQAGVASAVASTSRQVGQSLGVAVCGSVVAGSLHGSLRGGFVPASHAGWLVLAGCGGAVAVLGLVTGGSWAMRTATRTAAALTLAPGEASDVSDPGSPGTPPAAARRAQPGGPVSRSLPRSAHRA